MEKKNVVFMALILGGFFLSYIAFWNIFNPQAAVAETPLERHLSFASFTLQLPAPIELPPLTYKPSFTSAAATQPATASKPLANPPRPYTPPSRQLSLSDGPMISFDLDDGFRSAYANAMPIFNAAGFKVTVYIITHYIGYSGYINTQEIWGLLAQGHEIGAHTQTHPHLTQITPTQEWNEINGSRQDLVNIGITPTTFDYPYSEVNLFIETLVKAAGFSGGRSGGDGVNDKSTDPYLLKYDDLTSGTTFDDAKKFIDEAIAGKKWLILGIHRVNETDKAGENISSALITQIVNYVKEKQVPVVTNAEGLRFLQTVD